MSARRRLQWLPAAALAAVVTGSCRSPAECAPATPPVLLGTWSYSATQTSPSASLTGALQITSQCGLEIGGTLDATQDDGQGHTQRLVGAVSGTLVGSSSVDFDAYLDPTPRRHVGTVRNDSLLGTWVEPTSGATLSGSFTSAWTSTP